MILKQDTDGAVITPEVRKQARHKEIIDCICKVQHEDCRKENKERYLSTVDFHKWKVAVGIACFGIIAGCAITVLVIVSNISKKWGSFETTVAIIAKRGDDVATMKNLVQEMVDLEKRKQGLRP